MSFAIKCHYYRMRILKQLQDTTNKIQLVAYGQFVRHVVDKNNTSSTDSSVMSDTNVHGNSYEPVSPALSLFMESENVHSRVNIENLAIDDLPQGFEHRYLDQYVETLHNLFCVFS